MSDLHLEVYIIFWNLDNIIWMIPLFAAGLIDRILVRVYFEYSKLRLAGRVLLMTTLQWICMRSVIFFSHNGKPPILSWSKDWLISGGYGASKWTIFIGCYAISQCYPARKPFESGNTVKSHPTAPGLSEVSVYAHDSYINLLHSTRHHFALLENSPPGHSTLEAPAHSPWLWIWKDSCSS